MYASPGTGSRSIVWWHGSSSAGFALRGVLFALALPVPRGGGTEPAGPVTGTVARTAFGPRSSVQSSGIVAGLVAPPSFLCGVRTSVSGPAMKAAGPIVLTVAGGTAPEAVSARSPEPGIGVDGAARPDQAAPVEVPCCATVIDSRADAVTDVASSPVRSASAAAGRV